MPHCANDSSSYIFQRRSQSIQRTYDFRMDPLQNRACLLLLHLFQLRCLLASWPTLFNIAELPVAPAVVIPHVEMCDTAKELSTKNLADSLHATDTKIKLRAAGVIPLSS